MRAGDLFPPVSVIRLLGRWLVADGHKRYVAWAGLGGKEIVVEVWPLRRWLADQAGQAARNARKNGRIVGPSLRRPAGVAPAGPHHGGALAAGGALPPAAGDPARQEAREPPRVSDGILAPGAGRRLLLRIAKDAAIERSRLAGAAATLATVAGAQLLLTWLVKEWLEGPLTGGSFLPVRGLLLKAAGVTLLLATAVVLVALPRRERQPASPRAPARPGDAEGPGEPRAGGEEPSGRRARLEGLLGRRQPLRIRRGPAQEAHRGRPRRHRLDRRGLLRGVAPRPRGARPGPVPRPPSRPPRTGREEEGRPRAEGAGRAPRRLHRAALRADDDPGVRRRSAGGGAIRGDERDATAGASSPPSSGPRPSSPRSSS